MMYRQTGIALNAPAIVMEGGKKVTLFSRETLEILFKMNNKF